MALLQALLALIGRSAGRILNAVFGWAVRALFGFVSGAEKTLLTIVVALAALWPLLVLGVAFPRFASFLVAFAPIPEDFPAGILRMIWLGFALLAPTLLGLVLAARPAPNDALDPFLQRAARGYPTTLGIALAFWISFVTVPVRRLVSALHRRTETYVPLVTTREGYAPTAERIARALNAHGFALERREPGFWIGLPLRILAKLGGRALAEHVPSDVAYLSGPELEATLYPAGLVLSGREEKTAFAHGLVVEALANADAFQTTTPKAQELERKIRRVWRVLDAHPAHVESRVLEERLAEISDEIAELEAPYDDWQTVYRQALQLGRALEGAPQLLDRTLDEKPDEPQGVLDMHEPEQLSTLGLMREITTTVSQIARKEVQLARAEVKQDFRAELGMVKAVGVAVVLGSVALAMLLVAAVLALALVMPAWAAALVVAGVSAVAAGITGAVGWSRRVTKPLALTRKTVEEDVEWARERMA